MKQIILAATLCFFTTIAFAQDAKPSITGLSWLSGCWQSTSKKVSTVERWTQPNGQMMLGVSQTVKNDKTTFYEFMRIIENEKDIFLIVNSPENKDEVSFKLIKTSDKEVIFENPEHDFPNRIIYKRDKDSLKGRIEGKNNGKETSVDFPMIKAKCE